MVRMYKYTALKLCWSSLESFILKTRK
jgi:hypothetical protein